MAIATYPFFGKVAELVGTTVTPLQGDCAAAEVHRRMSELYGEREGTYRMTNMVLQSQCQLGCDRAGGERKTAGPFADKNPEERHDGGVAGRGSSALPEEGRSRWRHCNPWQSSIRSRSISPLDIYCRTARRLRSGQKALATSSLRCAKLFETKLLEDCSAQLPAVDPLKQRMAAEGTKETRPISWLEQACRKSCRAASADFQNFCPAPEVSKTPSHRRTPVSRCLAALDSGVRRNSLPRT
jgi:hypothetical protein